MKWRKPLKITLSGIIAAYLTVVMVVISIQDQFIFQPEPLPHDYEFSSDRVFEEWWELNDIDTLHALCLKTNNPFGVILHFPGNAGNVEMRLPLASKFLDSGYDIVMPDYPGFGKSRGDRKQRHLFEDAEIWYKRVEASYPNKKIIVYGQGFGTGIAARTAQKHNSEALILESPYYSMLDLGWHDIPWLPGIYAQYPLRTDKFVRKFKGPVFIFHGDQDEVIYPGSSEKLAQRCFGEDDRRYLINGSGHNDLDQNTEFRTLLKNVLRDLSVGR